MMALIAEAMKAQWGSKLIANTGRHVTANVVVT